ncbi:MAG: hypothetical protein CMH21_04150 [Methylophaga sp.]|jgi:O-antigen ligase|uniref:O-antigen ligase family protein n=2 Tax=Methylophaga TaxID=40222 RepID=UPI000C8F13B9|nr:O-antigen ligase family protein [Methylophaga sp. UBA1464]MAK67369.1 hypothetical protein [Methylophaga sp.]MAY16908.1 hypothetical protein [Methylophaga sp.]MBN46577.1 hypothetical protein [Methylophaga sp.]HCD05961.1 hypothetical protein [Methylophaga sp.]|tara:strand:- start:100446 stop:101672 length:1227 start_codon:yes stop_codon:yes gene_type:complete
MLNRLKSFPAAEKTIFVLMNIWLAGFFLSPTGKQHYQFFILSIVLSAFWLIFAQKINYRSLLNSKVLMSASFYALLFLISIAWSNDLGFSAKFKDIKTFLYLIFFALVFLYVINGQSKRMITVVNILIVAAVISLLINLFVFYAINGEDMSARFFGMGRLWNPLWAAAMYGATALTILAILLDKFNQFKPVFRGMFLLAYVLMLGAVVLTQSRTPIAATIMLSLFIVMVSQQSLKIKISVILTSGIIGVITLLYSLPFIQEQMGRGQSYRLDLWFGFIERAKEHLFLGHGGGSNVPISSPVDYVDGWYHYHSTYVASLVEMGLAGLFLHLLLIVTTLSAAWKMRNIFIVKVAAIVFIYTCILGITFGHGILTRMNSQWLIFWMPLLVIAIYEISSNKMSVRNDSPDVQ